MWTVVLTATVRCSPAADEAATVQFVISISQRGAAFSSYENTAEADIFVFEDDRRRRLDTYQRMKIKDGKVSAFSTSGDKIIAVIINSGKSRSDWAGIDSWDALAKTRASILSEDPETPLLSGSTRIARKTDRNCVIELKPLLSRIQLRSISCDFSGKAYEGEELKDAKIYLTNVSASCGILDEAVANVVETINTAGLNPLDIALLQFPDLLSAKLPGTIGVHSIKTETDLFCYPNQCREETAGSRFTRLVIEGRIRGVTYYWPIDINRENFGPVQGDAGIDRDQSYIYDVKLTRTGSFDPDVPVSAADIELNCQVLPWQDMKETTELF